MGKKDKKKTTAPFVVEIVSAANIPPPPHSSGTEDPHITAVLKGSDGKKKGNEIQTSVYMNTHNPLFRSYRSFGAEAEDSDTIDMKLRDFNYVKRDEFLGKLTVPVKDIPADGTEATFVIETKRKAETPCTLKIRRVLYDASKPIKKRVYFIRHGYSEWNKAQEHKDIQGMVGTRDHPLTAIGVDEADALHAKWVSLDGEEPTEELGEAGTIRRTMEEEFSKAEVAYSSPLCRAVQTAIVALEGHEAVTNHGITCLRDAREMKGIGGIDCIGIVKGDAIGTRAMEEMERVKDEAYARKYNKIAIHPGTSISEWWTLFKDSKKEIAFRFNDFWQFVQFQKEESIIVVGHSNFFKHCVARSAKHAVCDDKQLQKELASGKHKLANGACLGLDVTFEPGHDAVIEKAALLFGSSLKGKKDKDESS